MNTKTRNTLIAGAIGTLCLGPLGAAGVAWAANHFTPEDEVTSVDFSVWHGDQLMKVIPTADELRNILRVMKANESNFDPSITRIGVAWSDDTVEYFTYQEAQEQLEELQGEISPEDLLPGQEGLLAKLPSCSARLDILHFEQLTASVIEDDDEEFLDPGALLGVAEALAQLLDGVAVDPGSGTFV